MTHRIYFIISLLLLPFMGKAQLHTELLLNGGFEQYAPPATPPSSGDEDDDEEGDDEEEEEPKSSKGFWEKVSKKIKNFIGETEEEV